MENFFGIFPQYGKLFSTPWKTSPRRLQFFILHSAFFIAVSAPEAQAQLGPYPIVTPQATFEAEIIKREKDILWVRRQTSDGSRAPQVGIAVADVQQVQMPRPTLFAAAERIRTAPAATDAQFAAAHRALDTFILQTRSLRDIPGIPANEAVLIKGRLYDRKGLAREALRQYENVVTHAAGTDLAAQARILAGIAYSRVDEPHFAIEYLAGVDLPEEDEELLSALLFALGNAYLALENYDNALMSFLPLVVFYPYVHDNEPRGMAAALACYAALGEWEPLYRTIQEIKKNYPDTPAARTADEFIADYREQLADAGQFVDGEPVVDAPAAPAPASTPAPAEPETDIEYPEGI